MLIFRGLDDDTKEAVLERHNLLRRKVAKGLETRGTSSRVYGQPPAANMKELVETLSPHTWLKHVIGLEK